MWRAAHHFVFGWKLGCCRPKWHIHVEIRIFSVCSAGFDVRARALPAMSITDGIGQHRVRSRREGRGSRLTIEIGKCAARDLHQAQS
jgi:hypothetical protein